MNANDKGESMNMFSKTICAISLGMIVLAPAVSTTVMAAPTAAAEQQAATNLIQHLNAIQSLTANFEQESKIEKNPKVQQRNLSAQHMNQKFTGVMKVERPGKFYWEISKPTKQVIVSEGKNVWIHDPDLNQVVKKPLDQEFANTPALLLSGNQQQIMKTYRVTQPNKNKTYYKLYPKQEDGAFQSLTLSFGAKNVPTLMILEDSLGKMTYVNFNNVKMNPKIPQDSFHFVIPKGTDVISE